MGFGAFGIEQRRTLTERSSQPAALRRPAPRERTEKGRPARAAAAGRARRRCMRIDCVGWVGSRRAQSLAVWGAQPLRRETPLLASAAASGPALVALERAPRDLPGVMRAPFASLCGHRWCGCVRFLAARALWLARREARRRCHCQIVSARHHYAIIFSEARTVTPRTLLGLGVRRLGCAWDLFLGFRLIDETWGRGRDVDRQCRRSETEPLECFSGGLPNFACSLLVRGPCWACWRPVGACCTSARACEASKEPLVIAGLFHRLIFFYDRESCASRCAQQAAALCVCAPGACSPVYALCV